MTRLMNLVPAKTLLIIVGLLLGMVCSKAFEIYFGMDWWAALNR